MIIGVLFASLIRKSFRTGRINITQVTTIAGSISLILYSVFRFVIAGVYFSQNNTVPIMRASWQERLMTIPKIIFYYLKTFFYPKVLAIDQSWIVSSIDYNDFYLPLILVSLFFFTTICIGFVLRKKDKHSFKWYSFFFLWFILGIGFHLHFIPLDMTVSDRWFYFPMVGILGLVGGGLNLIHIRNKVLKTIGTILIFTIILLLSMRTIIRNSNWKDNLTLASHDIEINKESYQLQSILGVELSRAGRFDEAKGHLEKSVSFNPYWSVSWNNLGVLYIRIGEVSKAKEAFNKSISLSNFHLAYENLALLLLLHEDQTRAKQFTQTALKGFPTNAKLWYCLLYTSDAYTTLNNTVTSTTSSSTFQYVDCI